MTANRAEIVSQLSALGIAAKPNTNTKHLVVALERAQYEAAWHDAIDTDRRIDAVMAQLAADERARVERAHVEALDDDAAFTIGRVARLAIENQKAIDTIAGDMRAILDDAAALRAKRADAARRAWVTIRANRARAKEAAQVSA